MLLIRVTCGLMRLFITNVMAIKVNSRIHLQNECEVQIHHLRWKQCPSSCLYESHLRVFSLDVIFVRLLFPICLHKPLHFCLAVSI